MMKPRWLFAVIFFSLAIFCVLLTTSTKPATSVLENITVNSLRFQATKQGFEIGAAVNIEPFLKEPIYREVLAREFNVAMPENEFKFDQIHPERHEYDFTKTDALVAFAQENNMDVRGHTLVWFHSLPRWLLEGNFTRDELMEILRDHIQTVVGRYRGKIKAWDVVNEVMEADGALRDTIWLQGIGPEYIDLAFQWAREADPNALLFINDYAEGMNAKADSQYTLVKDLTQRGVSIDGVGFQTHIGFLSADDPKDVAKNIKRLGELGLEVAITEMDVPINIFKGTTEQKLAQQAEIYRDLLKMCVEAPNCNTLVTWGFTDRYTWLKTFTGNSKSPLLFDEDYRPKPAYYAMLEVFKGP